MAQTKRSEQPTSSLPGLPIPDVDPYDGETDLKQDLPMNSTNKPTPDSTTNSPKKGTIHITSHTLKKKSNLRKYKCKFCGSVLDCAHELTTHHQATHSILYCSTCSRAFNNPMSLVRHEYEHQHKDLKSPSVILHLLLKARLKRINSAIARIQASSVCTQIVERPSLMKLTSLDIPRSITASGTSA